MQPRDSARLLDVAPDGLHERIVRDLPSLLRRGDLLVSNNTRVIPARLKGVRPGTRGRQDVAVEALLIREDRLSLALECYAFLPARARLDLLGYEQPDIFSH